MVKDRETKGYSEETGKNRIKRDSIILAFGAFLYLGSWATWYFDIGDNGIRILLLIALIAMAIERLKVAISEQGIPWGR
jgi:hypothetical protein